ncbi:MAG: FUSC family protein [Thermaerobacter sp.]|nr:FUSC family protein [Thermaerobacter sp.]
MDVWRPLRTLARRVVPQAKAAVAAGIAWWLSETLFGTRQPYFAPLAAILTMQVTVSESVSIGAQRILGVIGGIAVSLAAAHWLRPGALGVALLVFIGMGIASAVGLANRAVAQVGISGLLVLALGSRPEYAAARLIETVLGALVGVLVQAFLVPADPIPAARDAVAALAVDVARTLRRMTQPGKGRADPEELSERAQSAREAVALARRSLVYSPLLRRRRGDAQQLNAALDALEAATDAVRGIAASLASLGEDGGESLPRPVLEHAADAVQAFGVYVEHPSAEGAARLGAASRRLQRGGARSLRLLSAPRRAEVRRELGAVLSEIERLRREIGRARRRLTQA